MIKQIDETRKFEVSRFTIELVFASYLRRLRDLRHKYANSKFFKSPKD